MGAIESELLLFHQHDEKKIHLIIKWERVVRVEEGEDESKLLEHLLQTTLSNSESERFRIPSHQ